MAASAERAKRKAETNVRRIANEEIDRRLRLGEAKMLIELQPGIQIDPRSITHVASAGKLVIVYQPNSERVRLECATEDAAVKLVTEIAARVNAACGTSPTAFERPKAEIR
jgi:hypothetical protein